MLGFCHFIVISSSPEFSDMKTSKVFHTCREPPHAWFELALALRLEETRLKELIALPWENVSLPLELWIWWKLRYTGNWEIKYGQMSNHQFDDYIHSLCLLDNCADLRLHLPLKPKQPDPPSQRQGRAMWRRRERGQRQPSLLWHLKMCWASGEGWILQNCSGKYDDLKRK